jgi:hypothetical protein
MLPSLVQLVLWPNFQLRLLLPHAYLFAGVLGLSVWRLSRLRKATACEAAGASRAAGAIIWLTAFCSLIFAANAWMSYHNFRTLYRSNEVSRVRAYKMARDLLSPRSRLFVAIMRGDQVYHEIGWRLRFFDGMANPVIELQRGSETPAVGDVIFYHERMARVTVRGESLVRHKISERGTYFLHTGWRRFFLALLDVSNPFQTRLGGNDYEVIEVRPGERDVQDSSRK